MSRPGRAGAALLVLVGVALGGGGGGGVAAQSDDPIGIPVGATPPAVEIEDLDGRPVTLWPSLGGKPALIELWATWCPVCEALLPKLEAAHQRYGAQVEFVVIAVAVNQSKRSIRRHLERHPMPFRFLWDTDGRATRALQAPSTSYVVALDARGRVAYTGLGAEQDIERAVRKALGK